MPAAQLAPLKARPAPQPRQTLALSRRPRGGLENPDHHLWNNHGTWFVHYTVYPTPITKERVRRSLGTTSLIDARSRRDRFFVQLQALGFPPSLKLIAA